MWIPTSWEPGLLFSFVTEDAVHDLKGCYSLQGVQDVLGGPAWESQVMDPLEQDKKQKNLHYTQLIITLHNTWMATNELFKWLHFIVSIIPSIFSASVKITDAHFASVNERIQPGLESTHLIKL